jgi:hypothetical protein
VTFNGAIGNCLVNVTTRTVQDSGGAYMRGLDSVNLSTTSASSTVLRIYFSDTGFTASGDHWEAAIDGTAGNSVHNRTYIDLLDRLFSTSTMLTDSGVLAPGACSGSVTSSTMAAGHYSLTQFVEVVHGSGTRVTSLDAGLRLKNPVAVPEPSSLALLGPGGIALARRRRG